MRGGDSCGVARFYGERHTTKYRDYQGIFVISAPARHQLFNLRLYYIAKIWHLAQKYNNIHNRELYSRNRDFRSHYQAIGPTAKTHQHLSLPPTKHSVIYDGRLLPLLLKVLSLRIQQPAQCIYTFYAAIIAFIWIHGQQNFWVIIPYFL